MSKVWVRDTPRTSDDEVLGMLAMKCTGKSWPYIAAAYGYAQYQTVQGMCAKVVQHDIKYSGEPVGDVRAGYW